MICIKPSRPESGPRFFKLEGRTASLARGAITLAAAFALSVATAPRAMATNVTVDSNTQFQTIEGWGSNLYIGAQGTGGPYYNTTFRSLYVNDLGCNIVRMEVDPTILMASGGNLTGPEVALGSDVNANAALFNFSDSRHSAVAPFCQYVAANALEPSRVKFFATIWSPPNWAKVATGTLINGQPTPVILNCNTCDTAGGTWKDDHFQYNARYMAALCKQFGNVVGTPLFGLSIQNELSFENPFNSCSLVNIPNGAPTTDNTRYAACLEAVKTEFALHPEITTKIIGPEMAAIGDTPDNPWSLTQQMNIIDGVKNNADTGLKNFLPIYINHYGSSQPARMYAAYWSGKQNVTGAWAAWTNAYGIAADGKESWNTEAGGESPTWPGPLTQADTENASLLFGNESAYIYWQANDGSATVGGADLLGTNDFANPTGSKKYSIYKQWSRYIRPGAKRVKMTFDTNGTPSNGGADQWDTTNAMTVSGFVHTGDGRVTYVIVNQKTTADTLSILVPTSPNVTTYNQFRTSQTENFANIGNLTVSSGRISVTVPAQCVVTLTGTATVGAPPAPTGLTATAGNTQVALAWTASTGATSYNVLRSTVSGSGYASVATGVTPVSYTNTGLTNGTTYYFVVQAVSAGGTSGNSNQASATPQPGIPPVPTGLAAAAGNAQVALTWNASNGATAYDVKRSTVSGSGYATVSSPTVTNYTNTGLTNGTTYYFVVDAKNGGGASANSAQVSATPVAGTSGVVSINCGGPAASPFVADVDFSGGTAFTNWTGAIDTTGLTNPAPQAVYQPERFGAMTYTIGGLTANTSYKVRLHFCENYFTASGLRTFNVSINGTSELTNFDIFATTGAIHKATIKEFTVASNASGQEVIVFTNVVNNGLVNGIEVQTIAIPPVPTGLAATPGNAQVALTWNASTGATAYDVKRSTVSGSGYATVSSPTVTNYTNTGLTNGTTYYFVVDAKNSSGTSANSSQVSAVPNGDTAQFNFESGVQGWSFQAPGTAVATSTTQKFAGTQSLALTINGAAGTASALIHNPVTPASAVVTYHVWIPSGSQITFVQAYVQQGAGGGWAFTYDYKAIANLTVNAWNTFTVTVPANAVTPLDSLGVQFGTGATWSGTCYVDTVGW